MNVEKIYSEKDENNYIEGSRKTIKKIYSNSIEDQIINDFNLNELVPTRENSVTSTHSSQTNLFMNTFENSKCFSSDIEIDFTKMLCKMIENKCEGNKIILDNSINCERISTIQNMLELAEENSINIKCVYKAIYFFDHIIYRNKNFQIKEYSLLISICLILACKISDFNKQVKQIIRWIFYNNLIEEDELENYEMKVCTQLDWNLQISTAYDFLDYFFKQGIFDNYEIANIECFKTLSEELRNKKIKKYFINLLNNCIKSNLT